MKTYKFLWLTVCAFLSHSASSQVVKLHSNDPKEQLKQMLQLPRIGPPVLKLPTVQQPKKPKIAGFNLESKLQEAKLLCPLLQYIPAIQLEGERSNNEVIGLKWETINGFDNSAFEVERSLGDTLHFQKVNFVWATEKSKRRDTYSLSDNNNYEEVSYYRLRLLLNNGKSIYSNTAAIKGYDDARFSVYPSPATTKLMINFSTRQQGNASLSIYDASGRIVKQQTFFSTKGNMFQEINVANLASGLFTIKLVMPHQKARLESFMKN